ncbi:ADP-ribosylglycohydrolase family protein [Zhihengliuella salsuginis]|uniref:Ribosylglycohydrolase n=1 Tax=Zhihengliuella salsuginis TaxID=578222 RepID=A0ABQ3GHI9_9MICC|nr:ADP-ribosylglycohydrolase family protein [Zhihengliuella salsuginis]GHD06231.1 ribosylglycohydrolase [Zhihengliuella salsuginis]
MRFSSAQNARIAGVLTGMATGDALGAGYEFDPPMADGTPVNMIGGGLGDFAPGEWTDDTSMAVVVARALAAAGGEATDAACDAMVRDWADWAKTAADVGSQTRNVFGRAARTAAADGREQLTAADAVAAASAVHLATGRSGGNGSLMRTAPVALAFLDRSPQEAYDAAVRISGLTHFDPEAGEACGLWTVAIRHAVLTGELDVRVGLSLLAADRAPVWAGRIETAEASRPRDFSKNGWVVEAFQGAWSAIATTADGADGPGHLRAALEAAVRGGLDTDTVAAIAGSLIGGAYGISAIPSAWLRMIHGWPGLRGRDLITLADALAHRADRSGVWPAVPHQSYDEWGGAEEESYVAHPDDDGVVLGPVGALRTGDYDAVVSLCRVGSEQARVASAQDHAEMWITDSEDNLYAEFTLRDAAAAVKDFRDAGKRVLLHCVRMESRTPTVAALYGSMVTGSTPAEALERVRTVLPTAKPNPAFRNILNS